eukprot:3588797-Ditylum_brightwellii.AAC.1
MQKRSKKVEISSYAEVVDLSFIKLLTVDPLAIIGKKILIAREVDGSVHCAEVIHHVNPTDAIDRQLTSDVEKTDGEHLWIFKEIVGHRKHGQTWDIKIKWEDDSETWESLDVI